MKKILLLNGPNLNMLGKREPSIYGVDTLEEIHQQITAKAQQLGLDMDVLQSNAEHELVTAIQQSAELNVHFIIINPAALTHTSIAIRDALLAVNIPFIEVHLSNIHSREEFRQTSLLADIAVGVLSGFGSYGYELALLAANHHLNT